MKNNGILTVAMFDHITKIEDKTLQMQEAIRLAYGVDADDVPVSDYLRMSAALNKQLEPNVQKLETEYTLGGVQYIVQLDPGLFTTAQYTDLTNYIKAQSGYADQLSCLLVPTGHKYNDGYQLEAAKENMGEMPISNAMAVARFFVQWCRKYTLTSLRYLRHQLRKANNKEAKERITELLRCLGSYPLC
jgi:hypothetical protein